MPLYQFFVDSGQINEDEIQIIGSDVNHIKNVLRLKEKDQIQVNDPNGMTYECIIHSLTNDMIRCKIQSVEKSKAELPLEITLFQGLPKQDKMEQIVQKNVELGIHYIVPVKMKRTIVKYDDKKMMKKTERWQGIADAAAKQSKRGFQPEVHAPIDFKDMAEQLKGYDAVLIPYENEAGMAYTRDEISRLKKGWRVAVVIGPEGGIDDGEVHQMKEIGGKTITLGNRILRTETAGMACLAMISYQIEET